jgi:predicted CxxxxCH...CXXCH cytochrome family protein
VADRGVGAHQAHLAGGRVAGPVACVACHPVPDRGTPGAAPHLDGRVDVLFVAALRPGGAFERGAQTCSGTYCHGATLRGGALVAPAWYALDGAAAACGACHGDPPPPPHVQLRECHRCHAGTVREDGTLDVAGGRHVNGAVELGLGEGCDACHGAPPATGAHARHATPPSPDALAYGGTAVLEELPGAGGGAEYAFGCGHCHPLDPARHLDGEVQVELSPAGAPAGSLRARALPGAAYDRATGTCSGVACHSSGQASPDAAGFRTTPAWTSEVRLACDGCHGNPPRHASGGAGAADANSHLQLQEDGYEWGHFGGLPGPWHTSKHGVAPGTTDAAPITCQACHAETVDPSATMPDGSFWLDTTGDYDLGGALGFECAGCHTGEAGRPAPGAGRARPLRHVNGRRDVAFDARTAAAAAPWLPPAPNTPSRPYWVLPARISLPATLDGGLEGSTLSFHLGSARYDAATKTCTSVACHLFQESVTWGAPHDGFTACASCHGF